MSKIKITNQKGQIVEVPQGKFTMAANEDKSVVTINIDGYIGWWHDKSELVYRLEGLSPQRVVLDITSLGGDPTQATAMNNYLAAYAKKTGAVIETVYSGFAASAATYFTKATVRKAYANVQLLYHFPSTMLGGTYEEISKDLNSLKAIQELVVEEYTKISTKTREEVEMLLRRNEYISVQEALEYGFITEIIEEEAAVDEATTTMQLSMYGYEAPIKNINHTNNLKMKKLQDQLVALGKFTMADLEGKSEAELQALLEASKAPVEMSFADRLKMAATGKLPEGIASTEDLKAVNARNKALEDAAVAQAKQLAEMKAQIESWKVKTPDSHTPPAMPKNTMLGAANVGNAHRPLLMMGGATGKPFMVQGKHFGFVNVSKQEDERNLNSLEKLAMQVKKGNLSMSAINNPATGNAWDFTDIVSELGAESVSIMNTVAAEYNRFDSISLAFTIETGIKHIRKGIIGSASAVSRPYHSSATATDDVFDWTLTKQEVHACMAVIERDANEFARTYLGALQTSGFTPYNYPAALHLMELFVDQIQADLALAVVKGIRNDAGTTPVDMLNGLKKTVTDIRTAATIPTVVTGTIYGSTAGFHHDIAMQLVNAIDEEYREDAMTLTCAPAFARALHAEYVSERNYTQHFDDTQSGPIKPFLIDKTNTLVVPLLGMIGSEMLEISPKSNKVVSFDSQADLGTVQVEAQLFTQKIGVAFQAGFNFKRVSTKVLAYNDQV